MSLYCVMFDYDNDYVEAASFARAVELWKEQMKRENGDDWDEEEEPESVTLITTRPVITDASVVT